MGQCGGTVWWDSGTVWWDSVVGQCGGTVWSAQSRSTGVEKTEATWPRTEHFFSMSDDKDDLVKQLSAEWEAVYNTINDAFQKAKAEKKTQKSTLVLPNKENVNYTAYASKVICDFNTARTLTMNNMLKHMVELQTKTTVKKRRSWTSAPAKSPRPTKTAKKGIFLGTEVIVWYNGTWTVARVTSVDNSDGSGDTFYVFTQRFHRDQEGTTWKFPETVPHQSPSLNALMDEPTGDRAAGDDEATEAGEPGEEQNEEAPPGRKGYRAEVADVLEANEASEEAAPVLEAHEVSDALFEAMQCTLSSMFKVREALVERCELLKNHRDQVWAKCASAENDVVIETKERLFEQKKKADHLIFLFDEALEAQTKTNQRIHEDLKQLEQCE